MPRPWSELEAQMSPESRARARSRAAAMGALREATVWAETMPEAELERRLNLLTECSVGLARFTKPA